MPLSKAEVLSVSPQNQSPEDIGKAPSEITFVRNRMMYARAALNAHGLVHFGLRHIRKYTKTIPNSECL